VPRRGHPTGAVRLARAEFNEWPKFCRNWPKSRAIGWVPQKFTEYPTQDLSQIIWVAASTWVNSSDLKVGVRVVIDAHMDSKLKVLAAEEVNIAPAPAADKNERETTKEGSCE
jgi:hypothetical protein